MGTVVVSYSLTGNNDQLAEAIAAAIPAQHVRITEAGERTTGRIIKDMILSRKPRVEADLSAIQGDDHVIFVAPVWMGAVAAPMRTCIHELKKNLVKYSFVSISGGALGPNPKLEKELKKRTGIKPFAVVDSQIVNLMSDIEKPTSEQTSSYRLSGDDVRKLSEEVIKRLEPLSQR